MNAHAVDRGKGRKPLTLLATLNAVDNAAHCKKKPPGPTLA
jgi:hypothetical protein